MALAPGTRLGPYEILAPLGAGGMGEVYRARDSRLGREVAVKVLPESVAQQPEALARFEREARAVASLSHPNILALHDFGRHETTAYAVTELLDGETLRERLKRGALPLRKAVDYATQMAQGLAAAHDRGVVHRDLKPENVFVTTAGPVKVLDFGLARQTAASRPGDESRSPTLTQQTEPGMVVGTAAYMSPEQARGAVVDHRSDVFGFGSVVYELLTGRPAFRRHTAADTMAAILREEPEPLGSVQPGVPPALERIVLHCLEKDPAERFQSMRDVAFDLQSLSPTSITSGAQAVPHPAPRLLRRGRVVGGAALVVAALCGFALRALLDRSEPPRFRKLTFQRGTIYSARFAADGHTVVYGAAWAGEGIELYSARLDATESRPLGIAADMLGISPSGEMALSLERRPVTSLLSVGRLARAPLAGGAPRELLDGVVDADWSRDGKDLAVTREVGREARLEYPIGRVLHKASGYLSSPRLSPRGATVAFIQHPVKGDDRGMVALADLSGGVRTLTPDMPSVTGLAWSADGGEIWFSAWTADEGYSIQALTPQGQRRTVARFGARIRLYDVLGPRALVGYESARGGISGLLREDTRERDLSWLDGSVVTDLSADGDRLLFTEGWEGGGAGYSFFLRRAEGPSPVRLGEGWGSDLSPDGGWVLSYPPQPPMRLTLVPTGPGEPRTIDLPGIEAVGGANWFPGGKRVLLWASETGQAFRAYVVDLAGGRPRPVTPPGVFAPLFSNATSALAPDGRLIAATDPEGRLLLYPADGGEPQVVPRVLPGEEPVAWTGDGRAILVRKRAELPSRVHRVDLTTGRRELWKELMPADPDGVIEILGFVTTPDGRFYAYSYLRILTELYVVEGLR